MKPLSTLLLFIFCAQNLSAQDMESDVFRSICSRLLQDNNNNAMKTQVKGVQFLIDPITMDTVIRYTNSSPALFQAYSKARQIEILTSNDLPIFPLKNTMYILDTLGFFSEGMQFSTNGFYFKVVRSIGKVRRSECLYIYKVGLRQDYLILSFAFFKNKLLNNYYFKLLPGALKLTQSKLIELGTGSE